MDSVDSFQPEALGALASPALDPMFWRPARLGVESAWYGHVPFAHWLMTAARPNCFVELGSHAGVSYAAFCDAALRERTNTRCFAVDTWEGDVHAGFYGNDIYDDLAAFHERHYAGFSRLLRCTFDDALPTIPDASIDLLHIDGRHHYEDVLHDYTSWVPKLTARAVVLFHDTNVRERNFGVWRLWSELKDRYPSFEFLHSHGLGVLAQGAEAPQAVLDLCQESDVERIRERFSLLGERWEQDWLRVGLARQVEHLLHEQDNLGQAAQKAHEEAVRQIDRANLRVDKQSELFEAEKAKLFEITAGLQYDVENYRIELSHRLSELAGWREQVDLLQAERRVILNSTLWRGAEIIKRVAGRVPKPLRRTLKTAINTARRRPAPPPAPMPAVAAAPANDAAPAIEKPIALPRPVAPARAQPGQRIIFISGEPDTPGHDYRVLRAVHAASMLGWQAEALTVDIATEARLHGADIVVIWRATWSSEIELILTLCRDAGTITIFDVDDLMFRPELARNVLIDGIRSQRLSELDVQRFYIRVNQTMRAADLCTCTTTELASHLRRFKKATFVIPNCWDEDTWRRSRLAVRTRRQAETDTLIRIGYASGTRTHQKDFEVAAGAIAATLRANPDCRLVLFRDPNGGEGIVVAEEFEVLADLHEQIEWRDKVLLSDLAGEIARFDINLAPLQVGNPFCEAKSELKYWEAALAGVPTIASPTGPYARCIEHGRTGYLATSQAEWTESLTALVQDTKLRRRIAHAAYIDVLWRFGPLHHQAAIGSMLDQARGGRQAARAMLLDLLSARTGRTAPNLPSHKIIFERDKLGQADVTIIVPVYNYAHYVREALDSAAAQTTPTIDLIVIDDVSKDASLSVILDWANTHADRFNRILVVQHDSNAGLGFGRNTGFDLAETPFVLPLDADNTLRPNAALHLAAALRRSGAAFAYPTIQRFGKDNLLIGDEPFLAARLVSGNFIDAMALVRRDAWAAAGGYDHVRFGWEDYDFWCRLVEAGLWGEHVPEILADYRAHEQSMLHTQTDVKTNKIALTNNMKSRHDWLDTTAMTL